MMDIQQLLTGARKQNCSDLHISEADDKLVVVCFFQVVFAELQRQQAELFA